MDKIFRTYSEQRDILTDRGMIISHPRFFTNALQRDDYYNIINGYKKYFIASMSPEMYIAGTTFEHVYALYELDQSIRDLLLSALLRIEKNIKSITAYKFSEIYGHDHRLYLVATNFDTSSVRNNNHVQRVISKMNGDIRYYQQDGHSAISHYMNNYGYVPLWVLNSVLSFGRMCHFIDVLTLPIKQKIASHFKMPSSTFCGFLYFLNHIRNTCAHGGRIYTSDHTRRYQKLIPDTHIHFSLGIPRNFSGNYNYGKSDVLAILITMKLFLPKSKFVLLKKKFIKAYKQFENSVPESIFKNIDKELGYITKHINQL